VVVTHSMQAGGRLVASHSCVPLDAGLLLAKAPRAGCSTRGRRVRAAPHGIRSYVQLFVETLILASILDGVRIAIRVQKYSRSAVHTWMLCHDERERADVGHARRGQSARSSWMRMAEWPLALSHLTAAPCIGVRIGPAKVTEFFIMFMIQQLISTSRCCSAAVLCCSLLL
jgi:hypothetical protein